MSLEEAVRTELLQMRKSRDGVTVAALSRTEALRQVLGGGDPRLACNALKHIMIMKTDSLAVVASSYSLGFASDKSTHLSRLDDFGAEYDYDQRQARRYSDKGIIELARHIGSEWTLEAAPVLEALILRVDNEVMEVYVRTERLHFIEMREPSIEAVDVDGTRSAVACEWHGTGDEQYVRTAGNVAILWDGEASPAMSIRWQGELWPRFVTSVPPDAAVELRTDVLGARLQLLSTRPVE